MHIPDGFLTAPVYLPLGAASAAGLALAARQARREIDSDRAPLLGLMGVFIFAAQMINFPVGPGTTGHLLGAGLLTSTLGPAAAAVVMAAILVVQALLFQDGGVLALGANVFNMALAATLAAHFVFKLFARGRLRRAAIFLGSAIGVMIAALLTISELRLAGIPVPGKLLGVSLVLFAANACLEGVITMAAVGVLERMNPGWVKLPAAEMTNFVAAALGLASLLLATAGVWVASSDPDGLEKLAEQLGVAERARNFAGAPFPDYLIARFDSSWASKSLAGAAGLVVVFALLVLGGRAWLRRKDA